MWCRQFFYTIGDGLLTLHPTVSEGPCWNFSQTKVFVVYNILTFKAISVIFKRPSLPRRSPITEILESIVLVQDQQEWPTSSSFPTTGKLFVPFIIWVLYSVFLLNCSDSFRRIWGGFIFTRVKIFTNNKIYRVGRSSDPSYFWHFYSTNNMRF